MSLSQSNTTLSVTIPAIPVLAAYIPQLQHPIHIDLPISQIKSSLRFVVIVLTYLLFRPHLEKLFRTMTGRPNQEEVDVQERVDFVKRQQQQQQQQSRGDAGAKKVYAVATPGEKSAGGAGKGSAASPQTAASGRSKRRKA